MFHCVDHLVSNCVRLLWRQCFVLELFHWEQLPAVTENESIRVLRLNRNGEVAARQLNKERRWRFRWRFAGRSSLLICFEAVAWGHLLPSETKLSIIHISCFKHQHLVYDLMRRCGMKSRNSCWLLLTTKQKKKLILATSVMVSLPTVRSMASWSLAAG